MAIQFDTLRYVEKLKSAGVPESQAKAYAEAYWPQRLASMRLGNHQQRMDSLTSKLGLRISELDLRISIPISN